MNDRAINREDAFDADRTLPSAYTLISAAFVVVQLAAVIWLVPKFENLYLDLGAGLPLLTRAAIGLGAFWLSAVLVVIDAAVFVVAKRFSDRSPGLQLAPAVVYLLMTTALILALFMPLQHIISLVK